MPTPKKRGTPAALQRQSRERQRQALAEAQAAACFMHRIERIVRDRNGRAGPQPLVGTTVSAGELGSVKPNALCVAPAAPELSRRLKRVEGRRV